MALLLAVVGAAVAAPVAEASKRARHSHVVACAAVQGAPCQVRLKPPAAIARLALLTELTTWTQEAEPEALHDRRGGPRSNSTTACPIGGEHRSRVERPE